MADTSAPISNEFIVEQLNQVHVRIKATYAALGEDIASGFRADIAAASNLAELQTALDNAFQEVVDHVLDTSLLLLWLQRVIVPQGITIEDPDPDTGCGGPGFPCPMPFTLEPLPVTLIAFSADLESAG